MADKDKEQKASKSLGLSDADFAEFTRIGQLPFEDLTEQDWREFRNLLLTGIFYMQEQLRRSLD